MSKKYVIIEGLIGAGKTRLAVSLGRAMQMHTQIEPAEGKNPYLALYYSDPKRWAFEMQIFLLKERYRAHLAAQSLVLNDCCHVVADRSYFGDRCFAEVQLKDGYFSEDSYKTYMDLHKDMQRDILYPSCFVYLETDVDLACERISRRMTEKEGRLCECAISRDYMHSLDAEIKRMIESMERYVPVIRVNPLAEDGHEKDIAELINEIKPQILNLPSPRYDAWQGVI